MRWKLLGAALILFAAARDQLPACGNKFLVASRGTRFGKVPVLRNAAILVYAPPNSNVSKALGDVPMAKILTDVGYKPTTVSAPGELETALRKGGWSLVLADLGDTAALREKLKGPAPSILPVLHKPSPGELAEARQTYGQVLLAPAKSQQFLDTVDVAVAEHEEPKAAAHSGVVTP